MLHLINYLLMRLLWAGLFSICFAPAIGQIVQADNVELTYNKTSSIIFPALITSVDRGSRDILAQKAKGVNNVLQLKAGKVNFKETNLTVITADGALHYFTVRYADKPSVLTINADRQFSPESPTEIEFSSELTQVELEQHANAILESPRTRRIKGQSKYQMKMELQGIYIQDNTMFFHVKVENQSNIPYHSDVFRFFIKDKQKAKRTASQELSQKPVYQLGTTELIQGKSTNNVIVALPKFTIPDAKHLVIELLEKNGGRHLVLTINNKTIVNASLIPGQ